MTGVMEVVDFDLLEQAFEGPPACESQYERDNQVPDHEAHWWAHTACGEVTAICERRRNKCRRDGGWWCTRGVKGAGCSAHHEYGDISWERIKP